MPYALHRLAAGNYDLLLDDVVVGSVLRSSRPNTGEATWRAELSEDSGYAGKPHPFTESEHEFASLEAVTDWLGLSTVIDAKPRPIAP